MKAVGQMLKDLFRVKTAKNPDPALEGRIEAQRNRLNQEVQLLCLSSKELIELSKKYRDTAF